MNSNVAQEIADSTIARWQGGDAPDTLTVFRSHPEVDWPSTVVCELVLEEYVLRKDRGETIDRDSFVTKFGERADSVARLLEVDDVLSEGSEFVAGGIDVAVVEFPNVGDWIDDALLVDELGSGSVGRVYLASRKEMGGKQFAVKVSYRLHQEANLLGQVNHPGIMPIAHVSYDEETGRRSVFMPFRGRATLLDVLRRAFPGDASGRSVSGHRGALVREVAREAIKPGDVVDAAATPRPPLLSGSYTDAMLSVFSRVADALEHAHGKGIVHSDIKPSNILLDTSGSPLLLDFSLSFDDLLMEVVVGGTFAYMPPESIRAAFLAENESRDNRIDVFSFGAVLYHMLCGTIPFDMAERPQPPLEAWARRAVATIADGPARIERDLKHVHPTMIALIRRCLQADPQRRPPMSEVAAELRGYFRPLRRVRRSKRLRVTLALTAAVLLLLGTHLATRPPYGERQFKAGVAAVEQGKWEQATEHFENVVADDPSNHKAYYQLTRAKMELDDLPGAYEAIDQAVWLSEKNGEYYALHGYLAMENADFQSARTSYLAAIDHGYTSAGVYNNLGYLYMLRDKKFPEADVALSTAMQINDELPQSYLNRASVARHRGRRKEPFDLPRALADGERAVLLLPDSADAAYEAMWLYSFSAQKNPESIARALELLEKALLLGLEPKPFMIDEDPALATVRADKRYASVRGVVSPVPYSWTQRTVDPTRGPGKLGAK